MSFNGAIDRQDRIQNIHILSSLVFGAVYLFDDFGFGAPYPVNVMIKATGIVLLGLFALRRGYPLLAAGLLAGSAGDAFLALQPAQIAYGIGAFGVGHIIYIIIFADRLRQTGLRGMTGYVGAGVLVVFGAVMLLYLQPHFGDLRVAASIYNGIILLMAILAVLGRPPLLATIGALLFVVSDSVLAMRMFADLLPWGGPVVWVTYYLGQAGIALGLAQPQRR